jgi:hypothetical protein
MTASTISFAPSTSTSSSFVTTVSAVWEALAASLQMARVVNQRDHITQSQVNEVRAMAERL